MIHYVSLACDRSPEGEGARPASRWRNSQQLTATFLESRSSL